MDYCSVPGHPAMEQENRRLRAEVERLESYAKDRDNDARGMTRLCEQYREERAAALLQNGELVAALQHMKSCGVCAEDSWETCEGGREALAALVKANVTEKSLDVIAMPCGCDSNGGKCQSHKPRERGDDVSDDAMRG
jgi:hypothetical protein